MHGFPDFKLLSHILDICDYRYAVYLLHTSCDLCQFCASLCRIHRDNGDLSTDNLPLSCLLLFLAGSVNKEMKLESHIFA